MVDLACLREKQKTSSPSAKNAAARPIKKRRIIDKNTMKMTPTSAADAAPFQRDEIVRLMLQCMSDLNLRFIYNQQC